MNLEKISDNELPSLFQASDSASAKAQSSYMWLIGLDLIFMSIASALAIYNYSNVEVKNWIYAVSFLLLLLSFIFTIIIRSRKFEDIWYQGRASAESCKTLSWRFMTCAELFESNLDAETAQSRFVEKTKELSRKFVDLNNVLDTNILNKPIISDLMWKVRNLSVLERKNYYLTYRIDDQKKWYSNKASFNKKRYKQWFFVIITSQALAMISVVFLIRFPASNWNLLGFFTTLASSTISWLQLKRHQELKQAYTTTAQELNFIEALSNQVNTDEELSKFVLDSENAISREHTLWLAQRRG